jgi:hypothetical protein
MLCITYYYPRATAAVEFHAAAKRETTRREVITNNNKKRSVDFVFTATTTRATQKRGGIPKNWTVIL